MLEKDTVSIPRRIHLVGIGGIHMSAIAQILKGRGHTVTGSDLSPSPITDRLKKLGITIFESHDRSNLSEAEIIVHTSAASPDNPEIAEGRQRGLRILNRGQMIAVLMKGKHSIAVAGSHGKTTTSSLIAYLLWRAGLSPTFLLGGEPFDLPAHAMVGNGEYVVVEADEFDAAFLNYQPDIAIVTNLEPDHLDFYGSFGQLSDTFQKFLSQVPPNGFILACGTDPAIRTILPDVVTGDSLSPVRLISYGIGSNFDWSAGEISRKGIDECTFVVECGGGVFGNFSTRLPGIHNVSNCLAAIAVGGIVGLHPRTIREAVSAFRGVRRRFEWVGDRAGITVVDDYAHHPTEVQATLAAAKERFPNRRLVCLFQPHTYSRTSYLMEAFSQCFRDASVLLVADTYAAREKPTEGKSAEELAAVVDRPTATYIGKIEEAVPYVLDHLIPGDVLLTVGAGDVNKVGPSVLKELSQKC